MKKWIPLFFCLVLLTGCSPKSLPAGMEEDEVLEAGREVVIQLVKGEFEAVTERFREDIRETITPDQLRELLEGEASGAEEYKEIIDAMATGRESDGEEFAVAVVMAKYEKDKVLFEVAFDPDMQMIGLRVEKT